MATIEGGRLIGHLKVPPDALRYLIAQRGALDDMKGSPELWMERYLEVLQSEFNAIAPHLPKDCRAILDVGGGMGGIDLMLAHHYGEHCEITILDGIADPPSVDKHAETFSNAEAAREFLELNGIARRRVSFIDANAELRAPHFYDLVVSLKAWCFHIPAARYAKFVASCSIAGQTVILCDVRGGLKGDPRRDEYLAEMGKHFAHRARVHSLFKHEMHCWEA